MDAVKRVPGARYNKDFTGDYWTVPKQSLKHLMQKMDLSPGYFYPHLMQHISSEAFNNLSVEIKHDRIKLSGPRSEFMLKCLQDLCSIEHKKSDSVKALTLGKVLYNKNNIAVMGFPLGLYWRIVDFVSQVARPIIHPYPEAPAGVSFPARVSPRPYQLDAVQKILSGKIPSRAVLSMATGAGKTIMSAMIAAELGLNTIFYTYSTDLLEQTAQVYEDVLQQKIGRIGGKYFEIQPITVATIQTAYSCREKQDERWEALSGYLEEVDLMFIDEGHMIGADTIYATSQFTNAYYSYALTATPEREDGKELLIEAGSGPIKTIISEEDLVRQGYVLPVEVEMVEVLHPVYKGRTYHSLYKKHIVKNEHRNKLICQATGRHAGKQVIVLVREIEHGKTLSKMLEAPFIHGESRDRQPVLELFKNREIPTLISSSILKQGVDIPEAEVLVLAHGGVSRIELMQKIGRVRRPAPNKQAGKVVDFFDYSPPSNRDVFRQQSQKRIAFYKNKGFSFTKNREKSAIL